MIGAVVRLVGLAPETSPHDDAIRDAERELSRARAELAARTTELARVTADHATHLLAVTAAQEAFDVADQPSDALADRLLDAQRVAARSQVFVDRESRREAQAQEQVRAAETALRNARHAALTAGLRHDALVASFAADAAKYRECIDTLIELRELLIRREREIDERWEALAEMGSRAARPNITTVFRAALATAMAGDTSNYRQGLAATWLESVRLR